MVRSLAFAEANAVGGFGAGGEDFAHAEFAGGFDDVVGGEDVLSETFVVRDEHVAGDCGEVDYDVGGFFRVAVFVAAEVVVGCQGVEDLAGVGEVGFEGEDAGGGVGEVH